MTMLAAFKYLAKLDVKLLCYCSAFKLEHFKIATYGSANDADAVLLLSKPAH